MTTTTSRAVCANRISMIRMMGTMTSAASGQVTTGDHTPGPWRVTANADVVLAKDEAIVIAWVSSPDSYEGGDAASMANARLIAAAPEMYAALKRIVSSGEVICTKISEHNCVFDQARSALKLIDHQSDGASSEAASEAGCPHA